MPTGWPASGRMRVAPAVETVAEHTAASPKTKTKPENIMFSADVFGLSTAAAARASSPPSNAADAAAILYAAAPVDELVCAEDEAGRIRPQNLRPSSPGKQHTGRTTHSRISALN